MRETQAIIERVSRANDTHQHVHLTVDESLTQLRAGQSLLARTTQTWDPYLREQWWPVSVSSGGIVVEQPATARVEPGQVVSLFGVIGQPYRYRRTLRNVLLIAHNTAPTPLIMAIPQLLSNTVSVTLLLLGAAKDYGTQHLPAELEIIQGEDDLQWPGRVTTVGWADQVFAVVDDDDELAHFAALWALFRELRADIPANYLFGVFRPALPCGIGACGSCIIRTKGDQTLVCGSGPAIDLTTVSL
ncbi:MAG: hypothetical protein GYB67_17305 [Chloroflexi bacterium]|nr:hypothetical protein [Chloroflexota bacterium]